MWCISAIQVSSLFLWEIIELFDSFIHAKVIIRDGFEKKQKQSFANVLQNRCSEKFRKFYRKTYVLESLFDKVADP